VHVSDVSSLLVRLVDAALDPAALNDNNREEVFGGQAYYFCASGTHVWGKVAVDIAEEAVRQGLLKEALPKVVSLGEVADEGGALWAANSKGVAERARRYLGWEPRGPSLEEEIRRIVEFEGERAGVKKAL
jgi:nucleoside-diphosphate-sugar epimerase